MSNQFNNEDPIKLTPENEKYLNTAEYTNKQVYEKYNPTSWYPSFFSGSKSEANKANNLVGKALIADRFKEIMRRRNPLAATLLPHKNHSRVSNVLNERQLGSTKIPIAPGIIYTKNPLFNKKGGRTRKNKKIRTRKNKKY